MTLKNRFLVGVLGVGTHFHERLNSIGTTYILGASIEKFTSDGVVYTINGERKEAHGFDSIIIAVGSKPYNPLEKELKGLVKELYVSGDVKEAGAGQQGHRGSRCRCLPPLIPLLGESSLHLVRGGFLLGFLMLKLFRTKTIN